MHFDTESFALHFRSQRSTPIPGAGTIEKRLEALFESERCLSFDPRTLIVDLLKAPLRVRAQIAQRLQEQLEQPVSGKRRPKTIVANTRAEPSSVNSNRGSGSKRKGNRNAAKVNSAKAVVSSQFSNFPNFEKTLQQQQQQPGANANQQQQPKKQVLTKIPVQQFVESNSGNRNQVLCTLLKHPCR